jgi:hypothetical protein
MKTVLTIAIVAAAGLGAFWIYSRMQQQASLGQVSGGAGGKNWGIGGTLNLNTLVGDIGQLFGGGSSDSYS